MKLPLTYLSKVVVPQFNALVALKMKKGGLSEGKVASLLGLTQPAVNMYARGGAKKYVERLRKMGLSEAQIFRTVERLTDAVMQEDLVAATKVYLELLGSGLLCKHHLSLADLPPECNVCMKLFGTGRREEREELVYKVQEALRLLEKSRKVTLLLPEVRSNLVARLDRALSEEDVVGIPGRLTEVKGKVMALHPPEFGASRHVARVLLEVSRYFPKIKAAMNLKFDEYVEECMKKLGWRFIKATIKDEDLREEDPILAVLKRNVEKARGRLDAFCHGAFYGLEPSLYLFAEDPLELAEKAIALANIYNAKASSLSSSSG